jgi:hypothetical protein
MMLDSPATNTPGLPLNQGSSFTVPSWRSFGSSGRGLISQ